MKALIDIGHPAHVHYFKNFYKIFKSLGHEVIVTARKKDISLELLEKFNIPYILRGEGSNSMLGKLLYLPKGNWVVLKAALKFRPDIFLSFSSPYAAQVSSILRKPHIAFDDTEHAKLGRIMYRPFTDVVLSPKCYNGQVASNQRLFNGYMELCYLHPNHFKPRVEVKKMLNIDPEERFVILRFVSWAATHDVGHSGVSLENKRKAVAEFSKYAKVFISSETELPEDLEKYRFSIPVDWMHDALAYADLFYGESATMASEAAMLGVPGIYLDDTGRGYTDELEEAYNMVSNFTESEEDQARSIEKGIELLKEGSQKTKLEENHKRMIDDKIDVTAYLIDIVKSFDNNQEK